MNHRKIGAAAGFLGPVVSYIFIFSAIASYPSFSWTNNALSDLGIVPGLTSVLFTIGLLSGGVLALLFTVLGLYRFVRKNSLGKVGSGFFAVANTALVCIGIFNENYFIAHVVFSVLFFVSTPIALFVLTAAFNKKGNHNLMALSVATGVVAAAPWILRIAVAYVSNVAIPETISGLAVSLWIVVLSARILKSAAD